MLKMSWKHLKTRKQIIFHTVNFSHEKNFLVGHNFFKYIPFHVELLVLKTQIRSFPGWGRSYHLFLNHLFLYQSTDSTCQTPLIAELTKRSPIIIQNSSNPSSRKNLDVRPYKVLLLTCVVNCTTGTPMPRLCPVVQWSVHWAPSQMTQVLVLAGARRCALETCGKKNASSTFRLG